MSNTLRKITIPKLNQAGLGKAILEQFANIDFNFQKLSALDVNSGQAGASCMYVQYNLAAPLVYGTSDINSEASANDYNGWTNWSEQIDSIAAAIPEVWVKVVASVEEDYKEYYALTGGSKTTYAQMAAFLLWGSTRTFVDSGTEPANTSLTGALYEKYAGSDDPVEVTVGDRTSNIYGNWLREFFIAGFKSSKPDLSVQKQLVIDHLPLVTPGRMVIAVSPLKDDPTSYRPVGSLAYWYLDPRYQTSSTNDPNVSDMSCVMYWRPDSIYKNDWVGKFNILNIFPTLQMGADGKYTWVVNGYNTGISPEGTKGEAGEASNFVIVERVENVIGYDPDKYPAGREVTGPVAGSFELYVDAYTGRSSRFENMLNQQVATFPQVQGMDGVEAIQTLSDRTTKYKVTVAEGWLPEGTTITQNLTTPENLYRIYRVLGADTNKRFFAPGSGAVAKDVVDALDHKGDPSCDEYYYGEQVSVPNADADVQKLIKSLNGAPALVLPGPAFQQDRTDTTFWFATLKAVQTAAGDVLQLVAYCSSDGQLTTNLDEHSYAGMMQKLDTYTYKKIGDNRNKPRGLILPIGSASAISGTLSDMWASHFIHSDLGGFASMNDSGSSRRGVQADPSMFVVPCLGAVSASAEAQFREVTHKRILHIGSVSDYRTLNYVPNTNPNNAAVPGREDGFPTADGVYGSSDFFGSNVQMSYNSLGASLFLGSEVHLDEPLTITAYRDLHKHKHLLTVEGDTVIGPHQHANAPGIEYRYRVGGMFVQSTLSDEIAANSSLWKHPTTDTFVNTICEGIVPKFAAFTNAWNTESEFTKDWVDSISRSKIIGDLYTGYPGKPDTNELGYKAINPLRTYPSFLAEDMIGSRVLMATEGIVIYDRSVDTTLNPDAEEYTDETAVFSVDRAGNMQTRGKEVRSNAIDTSWYFHTRWPAAEYSYPDEAWAAGTSDIITPGYNYDKTPNPNYLLFGTDKNVRFPEYDRLWWRANNFSDIFTDDNHTTFTDFNNFDVDAIPAGWLVNVGFMDGANKSRIAFDDDQLNQFGSNELLPTILYETADLHYIKGAETVARPHVTAVTLLHDGTYYRGRFGQNVQYGTIIGAPARGPIEGTTGDNMKPEDLISTVLSVPYKAVALGSTAQSDPDPLGWTNNGKLIDMFAVADSNLTAPNAEIGFWVRSSALIENNLIVSEDLSVNRAATVRGQIRAKSFRRHVNGQNYVGTGVDMKDTTGSLMFDSGISSVAAPAHKNPKNNLFDWSTYLADGWSNNAAITSPIVLDLGAAYGQSRLVKFGTVTSVKVGTSATKYDLVTTQNDKLFSTGTAKGRDHNTVLLGVNPFESASASAKTGYLYSHTKKHHAMVVNGVINNMIAVVTISIEMDRQFKSRNSHHGGALGLGKKHYTYQYGFLWQNQEDKSGDMNDQGECCGSCVCDGFVWKDMLGDNFPKPASPSMVFVNSLYQADKNHNWNVGGTKNDRDRQYGIWFRLTPAGQLEIASAHCPGAMDKDPQTVTLTFVYPAISDMVAAKKYVACFTKTSTKPDINLTGSTLYGATNSNSKQSQVVFDSLDEAFSNWCNEVDAEGNRTHPYVWIKTAVADGTINWAEVQWSLYSSISLTQGTVLYLVRQKRDGAAGETKIYTSFPTDDSDNYQYPLFADSQIIATLTSDANGKCLYTTYGGTNSFSGKIYAGDVLNDSDIESTYELYDEGEDDTYSSGDAWIEHCKSSEATAAEKEIANYWEARQKLLELVNSDPDAYVLVRATGPVEIPNPHTNMYESNKLDTTFGWDVLAIKEVDANADYYYFGAISQNTFMQSSDGKKMYAPRSWMCGWDAQGNIVLANSVDCYSKPEGIQTVSDLSMTSIEDSGTQNAILKLSGKTEMGVCGTADGFPYIFRIHKDAWNTLECRTVSNWELVTSSSVSLGDVFGTKQISIRPDFTADSGTHKATFIVKKNSDDTWATVQENSDSTVLFALADPAGSLVGGVYDGNSYSLKKGVRLWLGYMIYQYLIKGSDSDTIASNIAAIYNDNTGWAGEWQQVNFENDNFALIKGTCQSYSEGPVLADGSTSIHGKNIFVQQAGGNDKLAQAFPLNLIMSYQGATYHAHIEVRLGNKYWGADALKNFFGGSYDSNGTYAVVYDYSFDTNYMNSSSIPDSEIQKYIIPYVDVSMIRVSYETIELNTAGSAVVYSKSQIAGDKANSFKQV